MNIKDLWNRQSDHQNQWDSLGEDEKLEFAMAHEREECAKLCEELLERPSGYQGRWEGYGKFKSQMTGQECADAIRARGKA